MKNRYDILNRIGFVELVEGKYILQGMLQTSYK